MSDASRPQNDKRRFQNSSSPQFPGSCPSPCRGRCGTGEIRAWKLFLLAPRMLLTRPPRGGEVSRARLVERCAAFARGEWLVLIKTCRADVVGNAAPSCRRRRDMGDTQQRGSERTLALFTDPVRRPELPRAPIAREFMETFCDAQGMDQSSSVGWLGPDCPWSSTENSTVADARSSGENEAQFVSRFDQLCFGDAENRCGGCATNSSKSAVLRMLRPAKRWKSTAWK